MNQLPAVARFATDEGVLIEAGGDWLVNDVPAVALSAAAAGAVIDEEATGP